VTGLEPSTKRAPRNHIFTDQQKAPEIDLCGQANQEVSKAFQRNPEG
jgi:hypothetical protein